MIKPTLAEPPEVVYNGIINIRGKITKQLPQNEYLVEGVQEADTNYAKGIIHITDHTIILAKGVGCTFSYSDPQAVQPGALVEVTFNSPIEEGDPVTAEASQVVLLDTAPGPAPEAAFIPKSASQNPSIRGPIKKITMKNGRVSGILIDGVSQADTNYDKAYVSIFHCTRIYEKRGTQYSIVDSSQLKEGVTVEALFFGRVMTSYPVQAQALEIVIPMAGSKNSLFLPSLYNFK